MKNLYRIAAVLILTLGLNLSVNAQAFRKGSLLISVSEGHTKARYQTTSNLTPPNDQHPHPLTTTQCMDGEVDPFIIEYGVTDRWGFGLSSGTYFFNIDPSKFYGFNVSDNAKVKASTSEFTFDANYHFLVTKRLDLSAFMSLGFFAVAVKGHDRDYWYQ